MNVFEINRESPITVETFMDSNIYYIDNFYKNPDKLLEYFEERPLEVHDTVKPYFIPSLNGIHFRDDRHILMGVDELIPVTNYLQKLCNQEPFYEKNRVVTNRCTFYRTGFNDYVNNYWCPHFDRGYTGIIYLTKGDDDCGTNIYEKLNDSEDDDPYFLECFRPWRSKQNWKVIKSLKPKFNRCILFDGKKFRHGMNIIDQRYFSGNFRFNQVIFFKQP